MRRASGLRDRPAEHVLYGIDLFGFEADSGEHRIQIPEYLYDDTPWNDYRYLWNRSVIAESVPAVLKANFSRRPRRRQKLDADRMWAWDFEDGRRQYGWATVVAAERALGPPTYAPRDESVVEAMQQSFETNILQPIRARPGTRFVVFFPPYSILAWANIREQGGLEAFMAFRALAMRALLAEPNVQVHDFQAEMDIVCNFDHYKDNTHYSPAISRLILERIGAGRNRATVAGIESSTATIRNALENFSRSAPLR